MKKITNALLNRVKLIVLSLIMMTFSNNAISAAVRATPEDVDSATPILGTSSLNLINTNPTLAKASGKPIYYIDAAFITYSDVKTRIAGWKTVNDKCETLGYGTWRILQQPPNGILTSKVGVVSNDGATTSSSNRGEQSVPTRGCTTDSSFNFLYYTRKSGNITANDAFIAEWEGEAEIIRYSGDARYASISISNASLSVDRIQFTVSAPPKLSKAIQGTMQGLSGAKNFDYNTGKALRVFSKGSFDESLKRLGLPADTYSSVSLAWGNVSSTFTFPTPVKVLGVIRYSQYNTPTESACTGTAAVAFIYNNNINCTMTPVTLNSQFQNQVYINGTGISNNHGILKFIGNNCAAQRAQNPLSTQRNTFLVVPNVTGSCNTRMQAGTSVAIFPNPRTAESTDNQCNARRDLVDGSNNIFSNKLVADYCPACSGGFGGTAGHIDSYSSSAACSGGAVGDLGNFWTFINN